MEKENSVPIKYSNTPMPEELFEKLEQMAGDNRSAFIRRLIRQEYRRRHPEVEQQKDEAK